MSTQKSGFRGRMKDSIPTLNEFWKLATRAIYSMRVARKDVFGSALFGHDNVVYKFIYTINERLTGNTGPMFMSDICL